MVALEPAAGPAAEPVLVRADADVEAGPAMPPPPGDYPAEYAQDSPKREPYAEALRGLGLGQSSRTARVRPETPRSEGNISGRSGVRVYPAPLPPMSPISPGGSAASPLGRPPPRRKPRVPMAALMSALFAAELLAACAAVIALNYYLNRTATISTAVSTSELVVKSIRAQVQDQVLDGVLTALQSASFEIESGRVSLARPVEFVGALASVMARLPVVSYVYVGFESGHFYGAARGASPVAGGLYAWKYDIANLSEPRADYAWGPTPAGGVDFSAPLSVQEYDPATRPWFTDTRPAPNCTAAAEGAGRPGCAFGSRVSWGSPYKDQDSAPVSGTDASASLARLVLTPSLRVFPALSPAAAGAPRGSAQEAAYPGAPVLATAGFVPATPPGERPAGRAEPDLGKAVLGADIYLDTLQALLREFKQTPNTLLFVTTSDKDALVVASSDPAAAALLQPAREAPSAVLRAVQENVGSRGLAHGSFSIGTEGYEVSRVPLVFEAGAADAAAAGGGLVVFVVLPHSDLTQELERTTAVSFGVAAAVVVAFGLSVLLTAVRMTRPLRQLVGQMNAIAHPAVAAELEAAGGGAAPPAGRPNLTRATRRLSAVLDVDYGIASRPGSSVGWSRPPSFGPGRPLALPPLPSARPTLPPAPLNSDRDAPRSTRGQDGDRRVGSEPTLEAALLTAAGATTDDDDPARTRRPSIRSVPLGARPRPKTAGQRRGGVSKPAPTFLVPTRAAGARGGSADDSVVKEIAIAQAAFRGMCDRLQSIGKYLAQGIIEPLHRAGRLGRIGLEERELTIFFADVAGFTSLSESIPPERLAAYLQCYLTAASYAIQSHGGTVDKFIGDGVMAFWNAPSTVPLHAVEACRAATLFAETLESLTPSLALRDLPPFKIRMGIHKGMALVGNVGSDDRMNYTCIGDAVNLASRLESLGKYYGVCTLVSESVYEEARGAVLCRLLDRAVVVGRSQPVLIYELMGPRRPSRSGGAPVDAMGRLAGRDVEGREPAELAARYEASLRTLWARDLPGALRAFEELARDFPKDGPTRVMLERARRFAEEPALFSDVFVASIK